MNAKEKGKELYYKFFDKFRGVGLGVDWKGWAKECAIIVCDEHLNYPNPNSKWITYWENVKDVINALIY